MNKTDFWGLQRSIQERFVACTTGAAAPAPLAIRPVARDRRAIGYAVLGACGLLAALGAVRFGFGDLKSPYALPPAHFIAIYAGLFALSAFGFFQAAARSFSVRAVPYQPAVYLFPIGVIDARSPEFIVHRVSENTEAHVDNARRCLRVEVNGASFEFPSADTESAEQAVTVLLELRDRLASAGPVSGAREQARVDPLQDNGFKNPFSPPESLRKVRPRWLSFWPWVALGLGVLLGGAAFLVRNHLSEARLYAEARRADDSATYREYLARGGKNPDVKALLLPRTELRDAVRQGGVAAIEQFLAEHPDTQIKPEVEAALQAALLKELGVAQATGKLNALKEFGARYEKYSFLKPYVARAIDARVAAALAQAKAALAPGQSRLLPFVERLLRFTAAHGPEVAIRFQQKPTETLENAEKGLRMNPYFGGEASLPGQYIDRAHQAPRESAAAAPLIEAFAAHFPRDLTHAELAPALAADAEPHASVPTVLITYHTELSGAFPSRKPRFAVSGIGVIGKVSFEIPGDSEPLTFKLTVWRAPAMNTVTESTSPAELYQTLATEALQRFMKKYQATLFVER